MEQSLSYIVYNNKLHIMKTIFTLLVFTIIFSINLNAQEVKNPIPPKVVNEAVSASPGEGWAWVKGHWDWDGGKYVWKKGMYVELKSGYIWMDGEWERSKRTGWWKFNEGYWQKDTETTNVDNDKNTKESDKASKQKRKDNKSSGLFIKTGPSK